MTKGEKNTAHYLRFPDYWFHVFGIGQRSVGFSIKIDVKKQSQNSGGSGQQQNLGSNFSMWMLLERVRFTLDGVECNQIGAGYDAFNAQPDFCSAPFWSCLHNQLWNFWDADQNRISRNQVPLYCVQGRFERINQHPNAGIHAFSIGITEVLNTNLLIELNADDIEYVYQRMKCNGFFDFSCHIQYICISWVVMFCLVLAIILTVIILLWLLHQKGLFDPLYDWWDDYFSITEDKHMSHWKHSYDVDPLGNHYKNEPRHHKHHSHRRHTRFHNDPRENLLGETDYHYYLHHVHKDKHNHGKTKSSGITKPLRSRKREDNHMRHHRRINGRETMGGPIINKKRGDENQEEYLRHKHPILNNTHHKRQSKWKE